MVALMMVPTSVSEVFVAMKPLIVRMISEGRGGKTFSRAISRAIAK